MSDAVETIQAYGQMWVPQKDYERLTDELERLKSCSTVEVMVENQNVNHHVTEWENRCLKAESRIEELEGVLHEAVNVVTGHVEDGDKLDSFTVQPWRRILDRQEVSDE